MKEKKTKAFENGGFYIALCACILIIALIGYMSSLSAKKNKQPETNLAENTQQQAYTLPTPATNNKATTAPVKAQSTTAPKKQAATTIPQPVAKNVVTEEEIPHFVAPVSGEVKANFSGDDLVYHNTVSDWRTHNGVDFAANINDDVLASADGVVEEVYSGSLGESILVDHNNGFKTLYANLAELQDIKAGDEVKRGDVIGKVGESALADCTEGPHLHFEVISDGKNVNPLEYIE